MIWGAFVGNRKLPLVVMPLRRRTAAHFAEVVYDAALRPFLMEHEDSPSLILMEDGALVHWSNIPKVWHKRRVI